MARHDQRRHEDSFVCDECKFGACWNCIDVSRSVYTDYMICKCSHPNHAGEPVNKQIKDPETGTVYAPGLQVTKYGEVLRDEAQGAIRDARENGSEDGG